MHKRGKRAHILLRAYVIVGASVVPTQTVRLGAAANMHACSYVRPRTPTCSQANPCASTHSHARKHACSRALKHTHKPPMRFHTHLRAGNVLELHIGHDGAQCTAVGGLLLSAAACNDLNAPACASPPSIQTSCTSHSLCGMGRADGQTRRKPRVALVLQGETEQANSQK